MNEEILLEFAIDPMLENNRKLEEMSAQIHHLKTVLRRLQQFCIHVRNNNLDETQYSCYFESCQKFMGTQNEITSQMLSMKDVLIEFLREWKLTQKNGVIDGDYLEIDQENKISQIQLWVSSLVSYLNLVKDLLMQFRENVNNNELLASVDQTYIQIDNMIVELINNSLVIEEQPNSSSVPSEPLLIITKTKFSAKVRLLIASNGITNSIVDQAKVHVILLNDQEVNCLSDERIDSLMSSPTIAKITNNHQLIKYDNETNQLRANFNNMELEFNLKRRTVQSVTEEKFTLLFVTKVHILNRDFTLCALSLPIVIISNNHRYNCNAMATILWDIGFASQDRELFTVPEQVVWSQLAQVLSRKFKSETGVGLSDHNLRFIASILPQNPIVYNQEMISWTQFSKIKLHNRDFTFWEWFNAILVLTRDTLCDLWKDGLIIGFISSEESQEILKYHCDGTFLLRFSESVLGSITINYIQEGQFVKLAPSTAKDLKILSLPNCIRSFEPVRYLYPGIPKDQAFGKHYTTVSPIMQLNPNPYVPKEFKLIAIQNSPTQTTTQLRTVEIQRDYNNSNSNSNDLMETVNFPDEDLSDFDFLISTPRLDELVHDYFSSEKF